jgi:surfeit locus 1 family protein
MKTSDRIIYSILALLAIACVRLGFWQLDRRQERLAQNEWVASQLSQQPTTGLDMITDLQDWVYRKARIEGRFLNQHSLVLRNRSHANQPGLHVVTPFALENSGGTILVDRGWISNESYIASGIEPYQLDDPIELVGIIRTSQPQPSISFLADPTIAPGTSGKIEWKFLTIERIQKQVSFVLHPFYLELTDPITNSEGMPIPNPEIDLSQGPHLSYAIQWFGFAAVSLGGGFAWWRRRQSQLAGKENINDATSTP